LIQSADQRRVASIIPIYTFTSTIAVESIIQPLIVCTTSPPAIMAQAASNIQARIIAPQIVIAFDPTAGHILFATSLAHILRAI